MSSTQNITTIESQRFIKLILPNSVHFKVENRQKMAKFDKNAIYTTLRISTLQKVRKWLFSGSCNSLNMNHL
jgi:hypothetical protein